MSKSIKFKNNTYLDSKGITHNRKLLSDILYPVGSIYMSVNSTSPATLFGGTWTQISGRFLYCTTTSKTTGGSSTTGSASGNTGASSPSTNGASGNTGETTLTVDQIPSHTHNQKTIGEDGNINPWVANKSGSSAGVYTRQQVAWYSGSKLPVPTYATGGGKGHTHTLNSHTHTVNSHTHTLNSHTHSQNLPPYFTVYCWYRTA